MTAPVRLTPSELTARRLSLGLSMSALARALGVDKGTVSYWESGKRPVPQWLPLALLGLICLRDTPHRIYTIGRELYSTEAQKIARSGAVNGAAPLRALHEASHRKGKRP
jgi:transcriptional regulator with XRE-family HTH domain